MLLPYPFERSVIFADCALVMIPTAEELADIAIASAASFHELTSRSPRAALLSVSTRGSASHESIDRVSAAAELVKSQAPDLIVEGEIQFDAAIVEEISQRKAPSSTLNGEANVFVFPNLNAGNIGYKTTQRFGGATAFGPILLGLAKPANDLSRGCNADDVYKMIAVTAAQVASRNDG